MGELDALEDDLAMETAGTGSVPAYLQVWEGAAAASMCRSSGWCERHARHDTAGCTCCLADSF